MSKGDVFDRISKAPQDPINKKRNFQETADKSYMNMDLKSIIENEHETKKQKKVFVKKEFKKTDPVVTPNLSTNSQRQNRQ